MRDLAKFEQFWARLGVILLLLVFSLSHLGLLQPQKLSLPWRCPFRFFTGHPCPGCGMTDALKALISGSLRGAFSANPQIFPLLVWLLLAAFLPNSAYRRWERFLREKKIFVLWLGLVLFWWFWWRF